MVKGQDLPKDDSFLDDVQIEEKSPGEEAENLLLVDEVDLDTEVTASAVVGDYVLVAASDGTECSTTVE